MGSQISLWLETDAKEAAAAFREVERLFSEVEGALSRFDPSSELSQVNQQSGQQIQPSQLLWDVLVRALEMAEETGGLFDPTVIDAVEAAGYTRDFQEIMAGHIAEDKPPAALSSGGHWEDITLDWDNHRFWLPPGLRLDLGGIAKGYTAQQAAEVLSLRGAALVNAGGDVVAGAAPGNQPGWPVSVSAPYMPGEEPKDLLVVWLADTTLATSGVDYRKWTWHNQPAHHIIDPRFRRPAETDILTASVLDNDACRAEAWATSTLIMGAETGIRRLNDQGIAGVLVDQNQHMSVTDPMQEKIVWSVQSY
jgi:thiamine biosynthesis lipoprotein